MKRAHAFMQQWGTPLPRLRPLAAHVRLAVRIERARLHTLTDLSHNNGGLHNAT
jgi:hypothetical protein